MTVRLNGEPREVPEGCTLRGLVEWLGANPQAVAVAVNGEVVPRAEHPGRAVVEGDRVEVIRAVGGG
ncbi:thiamine biosynthesis protein ThiS [Deltaproteobacteria bacterium]|nr:thiamine biosynthesis protein ThiS [Deltaproteobacteria bacterium]